MDKILIIDDEESIRNLIATIVTQLGYEPVPAPDGETGLEIVKKASLFAVFSDLKMPGIDGLEVLARVREKDADLPLVLVTAHGTVETAVKAMKGGATDFLLKPFSPTQLEVILERIRDRRAMRRENQRLRELLRRSAPPPGMVGQDPSMIEVFSLLDKAAPTDSTILVCGESGTGKELIARAVHGKSARASEQFVGVNCAAFSENLLESEIFGHEKGAFTGASARKLGLLEVGSGGTVFLDEIGETSPQFQVKLLRVMQEGEFLRVGGTQPIRVDVRYVAATNKDLHEEVREGRFRKDLFYRLNVFPIELPPLRRRREDIPLLVEHFVSAFAARRGLKAAPQVSARALALFRQYPWPGNVRELENVVERALILTQGRSIDRDVLPAELLSPETAESPADSSLDLPFREAKARFEAAYVRGLLERFGGNVTRVAKAAGLRRETVHEKMKRYGIVSAEFKAGDNGRDASS